MGSCIGKCWCSCCDCFWLSSHRSRSAPINMDISCSTCTLVDSPSQGQRRGRADTAIACIMKSWRHRTSFSAQKLQVNQLRGAPCVPSSSDVDFESLTCNFDIPVCLLTLPVLRLRVK